MGERAGTNRADFCPGTFLGPQLFLWVDRFQSYSCRRTQFHEATNDQATSRSDLATPRSRSTHRPCQDNALARSPGWHLSQACQAHTEHHWMVPNGPGSLAGRASRGRRFARRRTVHRIISAGPAQTGTGRVFGRNSNSFHNLRNLIAQPGLHLTEVAI